MPIFSVRQCFGYDYQRTKLNKVLKFKLQGSAIQHARGYLN